jgi:hypothetical protein
MAIILRRRNLTRLVGIVAALLFLRWFFTSSSTQEKRTHEIREHGMMDIVQFGGSVLDVQRHDFLQVRMGRDERPDILDGYVQSGIEDYWDRFQKP